MKLCDKHNEIMVWIGKTNPRLKCRSCNKEYQKRWLDRNKTKQRKKCIKNNKQATERNSAYIFKYLTQHPCVDCGETDVVVLEFDHLKEKRASLAQMRIYFSLQSVIDEIVKCEVVCSNCHRRRTSRRGNHWRIGYM